VVPLKKIGPLIVDAAKRAKVPVCVHLDHAFDLDYIRQALELGFTGIMYDGSALPFDKNVENTKLAVLLARSYGAGVEAELGTLTSKEDCSMDGAASYTDPEEAYRFSAMTGIDALAPSFGTAHGVYRVKPVLDLQRVKLIAEITGLPLVMHGGSGLSAEDYRIGIQNGLRKINYYTYMSKAGTEAVQKLLSEGSKLYYHDLAAEAECAMRENVLSVMRIFKGIP
ncbi:MAG: class II fructose-bisphosphate aldolase, partial [Lachnospiraceae bacterium]|nr:class II fructose-bisphosphate aldolase [Lachnospiraceae bacterium]